MSAALAAAGDANRWASPTLTFRGTADNVSHDWALLLFAFLSVWQLLSQQPR
jgi:hypothetical protein